VYAWLICKRMAAQVLLLFLALLAHGCMALAGFSVSELSKPCITQKPEARWKRDVGGFMGYEKSGESCNGAPLPLAQCTVAEWIVCLGLAIYCNTGATVQLSGSIWGCKWTSDNTFTPATSCLSNTFQYVNSAVMYPW
jgi:hypothetical protein